MVEVISSRISSIFLNWSSRISSRVASADSLVSSLVFRSSISCCNFLRSSCSVACSSLTLSCRSRMQSECLWRICSRELCSWPMRLMVVLFLTAIIFWANVRVLVVSSTYSASGPMFATRRARALPPRQSFRSIVSAESRCPCPRPTFRLWTTVPRELRTMLMPMACRRRKSSSASLAADTFFRLSEPARSTSMSFPRWTWVSLAPFFSERLSTESMKMQWEREE
mmetsp:Transcript_72910/g.165348  ORF Transcript_72910/g.165348 Transcript_72910/m.165348 type:complete len:225 (-) Transcript_72910:663-1337(-)